MAASSVLTGVGLGVAGLGAFSAGQQQKEAYQNQAAQMEKNAQLAKLKAINDAEMQQIHAQKIISEQKVGFAAGGLEGASAIAVMMDSEVNAELDRLSILFGGDVRAANLRAQASQARQAGDAAATKGLFGLLSAGFLAAGKFYTPSGSIEQNVSGGPGTSFAGGDQLLMSSAYSKENPLFPGTSLDTSWWVV